jgi:LacI family transcriptional regulator
MLDGVIIQSGEMGDTLIDRLAHSNMPMVVAGRPHHPEQLSFVDVDNVCGAYTAITYLCKLGYHRIGLISGPTTSTAGTDRKIGFEKAIRDHGLESDEHLFVEGDFSEASGYDGMKQILAARPEAVFAASDAMAYGAILAIRAAGLRVPEDIAVVGYDDLPMATLANPQITTISQPIFPFGVRAVELLVDLIENGPTPPRQVIMETRLVVRGSCKPE